MKNRAAFPVEAAGVCLLNAIKKMQAHLTCRSNMFLLHLLTCASWWDTGWISCAAVFSKQLTFPEVSVTWNHTHDTKPSKLLDKPVADPLIC